MSLCKSCLVMPRNSLIAIYRFRDPFANLERLLQRLTDQSPNRISLLRIIVNVLFRFALPQYKFHYSPFQLFIYSLSELVVFYIVRFNCAYCVCERMPTLI
jgi:hypothetical protein